MGLPKKFLFITVVAFACAGCTTRLLSMDAEIPAHYLTYAGAPGINDGRERFREIVSALARERGAEDISGIGAEKILWRLTDERPLSSVPLPLPIPDLRLWVLMVPGAGADCWPEAGHPFEDAVYDFIRRGYRMGFARVEGRSGADRNADLIAEFLERIPKGKDERILLIGHSKGAVDILHFLVNCPEQAKRVSAVVSVSGPIMGSPLADFFADAYDILLSRLPFRSAPVGDGLFVEHLRRSYRLRWLATHRLPDHIKYFSLVTFTRRENIHPVMAISYNLLSSYDPKNDGFVALSDQVIPGSTLLGYVNLDHYDVALHVREWLSFDGVGRVAERCLLFEALILIVTESINKDWEVSR